MVFGRRHCMAGWTCLRFQAKFKEEISLSPSQAFKMEQTLHIPFNGCCRNICASQELGKTFVCSILLYNNTFFTSTRALSLSLIHFTYEELTELFAPEFSYRT